MNLTKQQRTIKKRFSTPNDFQIRARAGTGKTSTLIECAPELPTPHNAFVAFSKTVADHLRELGLDAEATWLEDPMTGAKLAALENLRYVTTNDEYGCTACEEETWVRRPLAHTRECAWVEAWRVTGDARYAEYLDACWEEAHAEQARRLTPAPRQWSTMTDLSRPGAEDRWRETYPDGTWQDFERRGGLVYRLPREA